MRGHEAIIRMRLKRKVPSIVFVNDYPCDTDWFEHGDQSTVCVDGDPVMGLDLRFLTGLRVSISALSEERAKALFERVKAVNPISVAAGHTKIDQHWSEQDGWVEMWVRSKEVAHG